jgi:hypothetical protein
MRYYIERMELFLLAMYAISVFALYQIIQSSDDSDYDDEDPGEYNLIDSI